MASETTKAYTKYIKLDGGYAYIPAGGVNSETKFVFGVYCSKYAPENYPENVAIIYSDTINDFSNQTDSTINNNLNEMNYLLSQVAQNSGVDPSKVHYDSYMGWSQGSEGALLYGVNNMTDDSPAQTFVIYDPKKQFEDADKILNNQAYIDKLKNTGSSIIGVESTEYAITDKTLERYAKLSEKGIPVMLCIVDGKHYDAESLTMPYMLGLLCGDEEKAQALLNQCNGNVFVWDATLGTNGEWKKLQNTNEVLEYSRTNLYSSLANLNEGNVVCNDTEIKEKLKAIRSSIKKSQFLSNTFNFTSDSTTDIPSKEAGEIKKITDEIANVYQKLVHDTDEIAFMTWMYEIEDEEFAKYAQELNNSIDDAKRAINNSRGSDSYYGGPGGYGGGPAGSYTPTPSTNEENKDDEDDNLDDDNKNDENNTDENNTDDNTEDLSDITTTEFDDYWPDYDALASDDDKLVYNCDDEFKLIVHTNGDEVTGLEHMFKFASDDEALDGLEKIKQDYKDVDNVDKIILNDNLIKVLFNKLAFKDLTKEDAKTMYEHLGEITKQNQNK